MTTINQNVTVTVKQRVQSKTAKRGAILLDVNIDGNSDLIPTKISWPTGFFDKDQEQLLPRPLFDPDGNAREDVVCKQNNFKILNGKSRVESLAFRYYAIGKVINHDIIRKELKRTVSKEDAIENWRIEAKDLVKEDLVTFGTYKHYTTCFNRVLKYFEETGKHWQFNNLDEHEMLVHQKWVMNNFTFNTTAGHMRVIKKFAKISVDSGQLLDHPSKNIKTLSFQPGVRNILLKHELKAYYNYFITYGLEKLSPLEYDVARRYLIGCFTGLRISDIEQLDPRVHIRDRNILRLSVFKTRRYGKVVEYNMPNTAVKLIGKHRGKIFHHIESALLNKTLRRTFDKAGIDKYLKFHSSRDTFATSFILMDGNVFQLQDILGHKDIKTTMIYVKMVSDTNNKTMNKFDDYILN